MKLPLHPSFLLKIPYFEILFRLRYEGFSEDFATYYNHNLETNPEENFRLFKEFYESETDFEQKNIIHNLGVYYFRYQKKYWGKRPAKAIDFLNWENSFENFLPTYNEKLGSDILFTPKWDRITETFSEFFVIETDVHQCVMVGMDMMFLSEKVPPSLLPAFTLSILIIYYEYKTEIEYFLEQEDPTFKII